MNTSELMRFWDYYQSVEKDLINTNQFVSHEKDNTFVYSNEFAKIILVAGAEVDVLLQEYCKLHDEPGAGNMKHYSAILKKYEFTEYYTLNEIMFSTPYMEIVPWEGFDPEQPHAGIEWWKNYQSIKHNRFYSFRKANLQTAIRAVASQYFIIQRLSLMVTEESKYPIKHVQNRIETDYFIWCV